MSDLLGLIGFGHLNDFRHPVILLGFIEVAYIIEFAYLQEREMFTIHIEQFILLNKRFEFDRILPLGNPQEEPSVIRADIEQADVSGGRRQATIEIIDVLPEFEIAGINQIGCFQQQRLILHPPLAE